MTLAEYIGEYVAIAWWREYDRRRGVLVRSAPGAARTQQRPRVTSGVVDAVEALVKAKPGTRWRAHEVAQVEGIAQTRAAVILNRLAKAGRLAKLGPGVYGARA